MAGAENFLGQTKILFSAIFIFLGATVFFISSLISGRNIFRDMSHQSALLISTLVGFLLFAFSPISFLVFAPNLFSISPMVGGWSKIHEQIGISLFWPFILSAAGLGTVFGALSAISARTLFLRWLRDSIRIRFPILSYEEAWDDFFFSIKRGGPIQITQKNQKNSCSGELQSFSIRDEPKQIIIKCQNKNMYRLIDAADIAYIEAPGKAFNKHRDAVSHQAEALYLAIAVLGLMFMAQSSVLVSTYFIKFQFLNLARMYDWLSLVLSTVAFFFAFVSFRSSRQDFLHLRSYLVLCPVVPTVLLCAAYGGFFLTWSDLARLWPANVINSLAYQILWRTIGFIVIIFVSFRRYKSHKVDDLILKVAGTNHAQRERLREGCQIIYSDVDLNQTNPTRWNDIVDNVSRRGGVEAREISSSLLRLGKGIHQLIQHETFLGGGPARYLEGEDFNIVLRLLYKLEKERGRTLSPRISH